VDWFVLSFESHLAALHSPVSVFTSFGLQKGDALKDLGNILKEEKKECKGKLFGFLF
jgi:hypothetical protein